VHLFGMRLCCENWDPRDGVLTDTPTRLFLGVLDRYRAG
jgi:hypothetical protein